jgi:lipopolysaccharide/colanic/teichoic acid biosynthesis glycosyltransferase
MGSAVPPGQRLLVLREPPQQAASKPPIPTTSPNVVPALGERVPERVPWERPDAEWTQLEPRGLYAERLRTPVLMGLTLLLLPLAMAVALPVFLINAVLFGSARRAFFLQRRVGQRGEVFTLFKFRTMRDPEPGAPNCDRARVTTFGRFLRNTHLDELPQLLNVLRGEMALIGPRPEMLSVEGWACERWDDFSRRLVLRPGLTGLAQITQGYASDGDVAAYRRKYRLSMRYVGQVGLLLDLSILVRTAIWVLRRRGWRCAPTGAVQDARARA